MQIGHQAPNPLLPTEDFNSLPTTLDKYRHIKHQTDQYKQKLTTLQGVVVRRTQEGEQHPDYEALKNHINILQGHYAQLIPHLRMITQGTRIHDDTYDKINAAFEHLQQAHLLHMEIRERYGITVSSDIDDSSSGRSSDAGKTEDSES